MGNGIVNGKTAKISIYGAVGLLALLIIAITGIVIAKQDIPPIFISLATLLVGFLIGTRTVSDDVKQTILDNVTKANGVPKQ